jgi:hypothetical protein
MIERLRTAARRHEYFLILLFLFASFRLLALLLFRPGGFIADFSDYDFYYTWGTLVPMGYRAYDNLWTAYPPLFPALMLAVFELSSRIPPWIEPRLFFHTLFGLVLLLFEIGNLILIYRLAARLADGAPARDLPESSAASAKVNHDDFRASPLWAATLYALMFAPVYTLTGWFEALPLFCLLLSLDLLLGPQRWGWAASAVVAALGFLTKLTPIIVAPVAVRWLGARLSWEAARRQWFHARSPGNLVRPLLYLLIFALVVVAIGYPFVRANPDLAFSSFRVQSIRPPWQSVWALMDGFYGYGLVPLDMRNLTGLEGPLWETRLSWGVITLAFGLLYLWLYTRSYDWNRPRTPIAFTAASALLLFLYSKGWSPQYLIWVLVFIVLLLPTLRGVLIAVMLSIVNVVEADIFLILLPEEHWIMWGTVLARTALLILLMVEFLAQIWPNVVMGQRVQRASAVLAWSVMLAALVGTLVAAPRAANAYVERRLAEHPCREAIAYLREEAGWPNHTILTQQTEVWRDLYPWLRTAYTIHVLDGYSPDRPPSDVVLERLQELAPPGEFWWIDRDDAPFSGTSPDVYAQFVQQDGVHVLEEQKLGACRLARVAVIDPSQPQAVMDVAGGPIVLDNVQVIGAQMGGTLRVVLYWHSAAPVPESYTVFVQLFDPSGELAAQQDNLPVQGLAPTNTWQPGVLVRDAYQLAIPAAAVAGDYRLIVGLYTAAGRVPLTLPDGATADHLALPVIVTAK